MKVVTTIARILVGVLFIISGLIKGNDPKGTGIKLNEYFDVFAADFQKPNDSVVLTVSSPEYEINDTFVFPINNLNSNFELQVNQEKAGMVFFEEDNDSSYGSTIYVNKGTENVFSCFFELGDSIEDPTVQVKLVEMRNKKELVSEKVTFSQATKHEITKKADLKPYLVEQSFIYDFFKAMKKYSLTLSVVLCILEVVFGFAILIGWQPKIFAWLILGMIVFFTFLTFYSALYDKVTDCGCFGDAIKLKPWESFGKDVFLLFFILIIFIRRKKMTPLFSPLFSINAMIVVTLASSIFIIYCNMFLPAKDFLPYKIGANIDSLMTAPKGVSTIDVTESVLVYKKGNQLDSFVFPDMPKDTAYKFHSRVDRIIKPGWKSTIKDFDFVKSSESDISLKDTLLKSNAYVILIVSAHLEDANKSAWAAIRELAVESSKNGIQFYAVTSSPTELQSMVRTANQLPFEFRPADETLLKTLVRSNPGVMLWHKGVIVDKWSCRSVPNIAKIKKLMGKK